MKHVLNYMLPGLVVEYVVCGSRWEMWVYASDLLASDMKALPGMSRESSKAPVQKSPIFVKPDSEKKAKKTKIKLPRQSTNNSDVDTAKKRKAEDGDHIKRPTKALKSDESERKKAKKAKKTTARPKGPVDVEKQCGVPLPAGGLCARSLTCKSHSMGSKRAVPGRSQPYDILLAQYQKKNHAKQSMSDICFSYGN